MSEDTTAMPGTFPDEQDGGDIAETIMARSYEKGYHDALNAKNECTLRDQFAMAAISGLLYRAEFTTSHPDLLPVAKDAYVMADSMILARQMDLSGKETPQND